MSPATAVRRNRQLPLSDEEEPSRSHCRQHRGLGQTNTLNVVDGTTMVQHRKVTRNTLSR
jgi:hypothetical protein